MNENYLKVLCFPAVAGLFFFMKRPKVEETHITVYPDYTADPSGLTGVARYLANQKASLQIEDVKLSDNHEVIALSGVEKYLQKRDLSPITGVARYALRQALIEKKAKQNAVHLDETGVSKYLKNQKNAPVLTGVSRYLRHQENLPKASKVAKYMARQALAEKIMKKSVIHVEETGVEKYLKHQESLPKMSRVARYLAKQALFSQKEKKELDKISVTGVSRYLINQQSLPKTSRVAKYIAKQTIASKQKELQTAVMIETGVDRYMRSRA